MPDVQFHQSVGIAHNGGVAVTRGQLIAWSRLVLWSPRSPGSPGRPVVLAWSSLLGGIGQRIVVDHRPLNSRRNRARYPTTGGEYAEYEQMHPKRYRDAPPQPLPVALGDWTRPPVRGVPWRCSHSCSRPLLCFPADFGLLSPDTEESAGAADDRFALATLYHATGGDHWRDRSQWLTDEPLGSWAGVGVTKQATRDTRIAKDICRGRFVDEHCPGTLD